MDDLPRTRPLEHASGEGSALDAIAELEAQILEQMRGGGSVAVSAPQRDFVGGDAARREQQKLRRRQEEEAWRESERQRRRQERESEEAERKERATRLPETPKEMRRPQRGKGGRIMPAMKDVKVKPSSPVPPHQLLEDPRWTKPQKVCPGRPSKKGIKVGGGKPPAKVEAEVKKVILAMADGKILQGNGNVTQQECIFITKECADPATSSLGRRLARRMGMTFASWEEKRQYLPDLTEGSLGSCALVANSDNVLSAENGADIDKHDTVFRHNTPVRGYEKYVGSRSTIVWVKGGYQTGASGAKGGSGNAEYAYALLKSIESVSGDLRQSGRHVFLRGNAAPLARTRRSLYGLLQAGRREHPSGGFSRPLNILASKLCTRVDLYGFSNGGGKYFNKGRKVMAAHKMGFEHWVYRYLQSEGKLCVYGD